MISTTKNSPTAEDLKKNLISRGVKYCLASYVDIHGVSKAKAVPIDHLDQMLNGSELYTGAAVDGVPQDVSDEEVAAHPDPDSATILPWRREVAWFASDLWTKGKPFEACSRNIFKRVLAEAGDMGFHLNFGIEPEFYILKELEGGGFGVTSSRNELDKPCYDIRGLLDQYSLIDEIVQACNDMGWDVYSFDHEDGNDQYEIDFQYADGLTMADRFVFFRMMVHEMAAKRGYFASFMPKPFANKTGSGAHYNMSLADKKTGRNLFEGNDDRRGCGLSPLAYQFIAGILRHGRAICAVISPIVNSYKRLVKQGSMSGATWAPIFVCYGNNNRTNMIRVPLGGGRRVECRAADISCNPYLGAAMVLAAGLEGVRENLDPGEPHTENMYRISDADLARMNVSYLPRSLAEAIDAFEDDPLGEKVMGPLMYKTFVKFKRDEWDSYHSHVSDWEMKRYLRRF